MCVILIQNYLLGTATVPILQIKVKTPKYRQMLNDKIRVEPVYFGPQIHTNPVLFKEIMSSYFLLPQYLFFCQCHVHSSFTRYPTL